MQNREPQPSPDRLRNLIANDPIAYQDILGKTLNNLHPEREIWGLPDDLLIEMDRYRLNMLVQNADTAILSMDLYPRRNAPALFSGQSVAATSKHADFSGLLQVIDRVLQAKLPQSSAKAGR